MANTSLAGRTHTDVRYLERTAATLSDNARLYRDAFVKEYIKDFSGKNALTRIGHDNPKTASSTAVNLLKETYVQQKLDEYVRKLSPTDIVTRQQVMMHMWKEAMNQGNEGGVRVAALAHVAKMLGMFKDKEEGPGRVQVGVMLIPVMSVEDWELSAGTAQQLLRTRAVNVDATVTRKED